ncbi:hypothetical protein Golob_011610 [Gossypium lobatum]|uniref:Uncharacterized protein n=1 Tax=Gossypium lobatum TaxID=34289 RepID=A0A7J8MQH6_9ROSI|nr:hypothetical protein [Gossypium lobatum]
MKKWVANAYGTARDVALLNRRSVFLARGQYRLGVQVGPKTHQRVCGEVETRDTHSIFHVGSTITLEDVQLRLGLPMDGSVLTGSAQSADWGVICYDIMGAISDIIYGGRIDMGWL